MNLPEKNTWNDILFQASREILVLFKNTVSSVRFNAQILNQGIVYYFYRNPPAELSNYLLFFLKPAVTLHCIFTGHFVEAFLH